MEKNTPQIWRQGDVLIIRKEGERTDTSKLKEIPRDDGRVVLAYGEVTGHSHSIVEKGCHLFLDEMNRLTGEEAMGLVMRLGGGAVGLLEPDRVMVNDETVVLKHEEHDPITLPPGEWIIRRQREYDPEALRNVAD